MEKRDLLLKIRKIRGHVSFDILNPRKVFGLRNYCLRSYLLRVKLRAECGICLKLSRVTVNTQLRKYSSVSARNIEL